MRSKHIYNMYNLKNKSVFLISLSLLCFCLNSQVPVIFMEQNSLMSETDELRSILSVAIADINGDYRDDIIQYDDGINFYIQTDKGSFQIVDKVTYEDNEVPLTLNVGDIDNSGSNDLVIGSFYDNITVMRGQNGVVSPIPDSKIIVDLFAQGSSLIDINNDGWLDALMTHDNSANVLMLNDGTGQLVPSNLIDFNTVPASDNSGNYSAIWFDVDSDNDLDLYIAKCRVGVTDPTDPRRINTLYINDEGRYMERAAEFQLDLGDQSWAVDSGDLDNDGDIDLVIVNHGAPHVIMENSNGTYIRHELSHFGQAITTEDLQVSIADFNNDGLQDILIAGLEDYLLLNQSDLEFFIDTNPFGTKRASTFALGDLNEDGYVDAFVGVLGFSDKVWLNNGGNNNYVSLSLNGVQSNRSGIGSQLHVYTPSGNYVKWLKSGVAYGITNSLNVHFGLGAETVIDSVVCVWPSGIKDIYYDVDINTHFVLTESVCMAPILNIETDDTAINCTDDSIVLRSNYDPPILWNTGLIIDSIIVTESGFYYATSTDNCENISQIIEVRESQSVKPELFVVDTLLLCINETFQLTTQSDELLTWSNGLTAESIDISEPGAYYAYSDIDCEDFYSDTLIVEYIEVLGNDISETYMSPLTDTVLTTGYDNIVWYFNTSASSIITDSDSLQIDNIENDTVFYFTIVDANGCISDVFKYEIFIDSLSSIDDLSNIGLRIYPNPVDDDIKITADIIIDYVMIQKVSGEILYTSESSTQDLKIETSHWPQGIYIINGRTAQGQFVRKLIKL